MIGTVCVEDAELVYLELNLKWAKIDFFQGDRLSYDGDGILGFIKIYALKFLLQLL